MPFGRVEARRRTLLAFASLRWRPMVDEVQRAGEGRIFTVSDVPPRPMALVLGAPVREMKPSAILEDRVQTGVELLRARKVDKLLLSGTPAEVAVMSTLCAELELSGDQQLLDPRGRHTFESLRNAREAGHRELILVSQRFHLPRALYIAEWLGLDALGVEADRRPYLHQKRFERRELFSSVLAYWMTR